MISPSQLIPDWLPLQLLRDELPWGSAVTMTLHDFRSRASVHDSWWIGLWTVPPGEGVCALRWDVFWTTGQEMSPKLEPYDLPILLIRLRDLVRVTHSRNTDTSYGDVEYIYDLRSDRLTRAEAAALIAAVNRGIPEEGSIEPFPAELWRTEVGGDSGTVELVHGPEAKILALQSDGAVFPLPLTNADSVG